MKIKAITITVIILLSLLLGACGEDSPDCPALDYHAYATGMLTWLSNNRHQTARLPYSHVGDPALTNFIILYDAALCSMAYAAMDRLDDAAALVDYYRNTTTVKRLGGLIEVFKLDPGFSGIDWNVRMGANLWMRLASLFLYHKTHNAVYLEFSRQQADFALSWQIADTTSSNYGGIPLGPAGDPAYPGDQHIGNDPGQIPYTNIFATEIQIDAHALTRMLFMATGLSEYSNASRLLLTWISNNAHRPGEGRFNRARLDATISADIHSWGVSSLGPAVLNILEENLPANMLAFVETNCVNTCNWQFPGGATLQVTGTDFISRDHALALGRAPLVSPEWTFQLINAYRKLADWQEITGFYGRATTSRARANYLLQQMLALAVPRDGGLAYPYATAGNAPIGHENNTPAANNLSAIGAAYGILVLKGIDPLDFM